MVREIVSAKQSAGIDWPELLKKLLVIEPLELEKDIKTVHGMSDAVRANVWVLTGPGTHEAFEDTLIFPKILQSQTRRQVGKIVVGRLTQGEAKKGQDPPWVLAEATEADLAKAGKFLNSLTTVSAAAADDEGDEGFADDDGEDVF